jgi:hypothetical protein
MRVQDALDRLDEIHAHLTRAEVYRGFRAPAVAAVGAVGFVAAAAQPAGVEFVAYWVCVAALSAALGFGAAARSYVCGEDEYERRRTRRVMAQFLPCLLAGVAVTVAVVRAAPDFVSFLPGLWAVLFGLGVVAARPHLPGGLWFVGLGYVLAGAAVLARAGVGAEPSGWAVGGVFGAGHLTTAVVLWAGRGAEHG